MIPVPPLSLSLISSVNSSSSDSTSSSSLASPEDGALDSNRNPKFLSDDDSKKEQSTRRLSSGSGSYTFSVNSPLPSLQPQSFTPSLRPQTQSERGNLHPGVSQQRVPSPSPTFVRARTVDAQMRMRERYHPYTTRGRVTSLELGFAARSLGLSSFNGMTLEDVHEGKECFIRVLSEMPDRVLLKAHQAKKADLDRITHRVALALAEVESAERQKDFMSTVCEQYKGELAVSEVQMDVVTKVLDNRGLLESEDDGAYHRAVYADELVALTIAEGQAVQIQEVVRSRRDEGWPDPEDDEFSDEDSKLPFTGLLSSDDSVF